MELPIEKYTSDACNDGSSTLVKFEDICGFVDFPNQPHIKSTSISPPEMEEPKFYFKICQCDDAACGLRSGEPGEVAIYLFRESSPKEEETVRWSVSIQGLYEVKSKPRGIPVYALIELL